MLRWLYSFFTTPAPLPPPPVDDLPPAKVAIIGAGMGGCFAAKFLRENGGKDLDIHVFAKKGSKIGGRTAVCEFDGCLYENGGIVFHSTSQYMINAIKQHGLAIRPVMGTGPYGIFDGKLMFIFGSNSMMMILQLLWRYGWDIYKFQSFISRFVKNFCTIYSIQEKGTAFVSVEDMTAAMGGELSNLVKYSAYDYFHKHLQLNSLLVNEFIPTAMRMYYAQGITANASITTIAHAGFDSGRLLRVIGGNYQVAECVLRESGASLTMEDVISVTKTVQHGTAKYSVTTGDGKTIKDYDVVIVAHPINTASIKYENFSNKVYTAATTIPYQRQVVTLCKGKINQEYFKEKADNSNFPQCFMTTDASESTIGGVLVEVPSEITVEDTSKYMQAVKEASVKVWKVYSSEPLTPEECQSLFPDVDPKDIVFQDWAAACPKYTEPYHTASFVLDDGVFYINAIEIAYCLMEASAIGAKNVSLLARQYLLQQNSI